MVSVHSSLSLVLHVFKPKIIRSTGQKRAASRSYRPYSKLGARSLEDIACQFQANRRNQQPRSKSRRGSSGICCASGMNVKRKCGSRMMLAKHPVYTSATRHATDSRVVQLCHHQLFLLTGRKRKKSKKKHRTSKTALPSGHLSLSRSLGFFGLKNLVQLHLLHNGSPEQLQDCIPENCVCELDCRDRSSLLNSW